MRRLRYQVATSLDGYIAGPNGEADWIVMDPDIDFDELFAQFDTAVMGRKTFLATAQQGGGGAMPGLDLAKTSGCSGAASCSARCSRPGWSTRWSRPWCRCCWGRAFRCCRRRA